MRLFYVAAYAVVVATFTEAGVSWPLGLVALIAGAAWGHGLQRIWG